MARRSDGAKLGICGLIKRDTLPCEDIGYAFLPAYRGQGYGIEAAQAALQDGRERLGIKRVVAIVTPATSARWRCWPSWGWCRAGWSNWRRMRMSVYCWRRKVRRSAGSESMGLAGQECWLGDA